MLAVRHSVRPGMRPVGGHTFGDSGRVTVESLYQSPYRTVFGDRNTEDVGVLQGPLEVQREVQRLPPGPALREGGRALLAAAAAHQRATIRRGRKTALFDAFLDSLRLVQAREVEISEEALSRYAAARRDRESP